MSEKPSHNQILNAVQGFNTDKFTLSETNNLDKRPEDEREDREIIAVF